jgi:hypothetical protein
MGPEGRAWIYSEIVSFPTSLDLSTDLGLMSHLVILHIGMGSCIYWSHYLTELKLIYNIIDDLQ